MHPRGGLCSCGSFEVPAPEEYGRIGLSGRRSRSQAEDHGDWTVATVAYPVGSDAGAITSARRRHRPAAAWAATSRSDRWPWWTQTARSSTPQCLRQERSKASKVRKSIGGWRESTFGGASRCEGQPQINNKTRNPKTEQQWNRTEKRT